MRVNGINLGEAQMLGISVLATRCGWSKTTVIPPNRDVSGKGNGRVLYQGVLETMGNYTKYNYV